MAKKISAKVQRATEEYLGSLGWSREQLTEKQWKTVATHVKSKRYLKVVCVFSLLLVVVWIWIGTWSFGLVNDLIDRLTPEKIVYFSYNDTASKAIEPVRIKEYLVAVKSLSFSAIGSFAVTISLFMSMITAIISMKQRTKIVEGLLGRSQEGED